MENQRRYEVQQTMPQPSNGGNASTILLLKDEMRKVINLINKMRLLQGYSLLDPDEADLMAAAWLTEFKRKHVPAEIYDDLVQKAFDHRVRLLQDGIAPPAFDLAELLSTFHGYYEVVFNDNRCDDCRKNYGLIYIEGQNNPVMCERPREEARGMRVLRR